MPTVKGKTEVRDFFAQIPQALETKILRGAARAAAKVVADEAKLRVISSEVRGSIRISTKQEQNGQVIAKVQTKGSGAYLAPWLEYGTAPHFISAGDSGFSASKLTQKANREGAYSEVGTRALKIGNSYVTGAVAHPGARPHPFLRPALDTKAGEAISEAQAYINTRLAREGLGGAEVPEGDE